MSGPGRKGGFLTVARSAVIAYLAVFVALNISVLVRFRAETARRGVARLPSFWLNIRSMDSWKQERFRYLSIMTMRSRRELAGYFVAQQGLSYATCARRLHGLFAECFLEDKGFWIECCEGSRMPEGGARGLHYMIEPPGAPLDPPPAAASCARVGPFEVASFAPALSVSSLAASLPSGAPLCAIEIPSGTAGFALPSDSPIYRYWVPAFRPGVRTAVLEGELTAGAFSGPAALCVTVRSAEPVAVRSVLLDGEPVPLRSARHLKMLTRVSAYAYDLRGNPGPGPHRLRFILASRAPLACDVDVYGYPCGPSDRSYADPGAISPRAIAGRPSDPVSPGHSGNPS